MASILKTATSPGAFPSAADIHPGVLPPSGAPGRRPVILVLGDYYLPGYKGGGTIRSLANLVDRLGGEFDFRLITRDRDLGASEPYPGVRADAWQRVGGAEVFYASPASLRPAALARLIRTLEYEKVYLNSFFSPRLSIAAMALMALGSIRKAPVIVAPRGELAPGALALKRGKKRAFLALARLAGLYRGVTWQATSALEEEDIRSRFGEGCRVRRIGNLNAPADLREPSRPAAKVPGRLALVYLSRIARNKNLLGALSCLRGTKGRIDFHVYGPKEDADYWSECESAIGRLPPNVSVRYGGPVDNHRVPETLAAHDMFFLPTMGENFGHAIAEALRAGLPALISDRTPWHDLEDGTAGWAVPLDREDRFREILEAAVGWGEAERREWSAGARRFASLRMDDRDSMALTRAMFLEGPAKAGGGKG